MNVDNKGFGAREFEEAARMILSADSLLISAGAGIGVDSGLPDFRGNHGFWRAYPPLKELGISFVDMANPRWFERDPRLAWGFYGHRMHLYRSTTPHPGFEILRRWANEMSQGWFVFTSNVDGQFQRAGFDEHSVLECHGSIHHLQCSGPCRDEIWSARDTNVDVSSSFRAEGELPNCPGCGRVARPNVLMFGDGSWLESRTAEQESSLRRWLRDAGRVCVVELGAGKAVPTVRRFSEAIARDDGKLIRINPRDEDGPTGTVGIPLGALAGLQGIDAAKVTLG